MNKLNSYKNSIIMKSKKIALIILLSTLFVGCSQNKIVELPLTIHNGYGPFIAGFGGLSTISEDENNPWESTYPKILNFPKGLTDMKFGFIETNHYQSAYQNYLLGNITKDMYEGLFKSNRAPDTLNLSKTPIKTKIAFVYGKDLEGVLKMVVDVNNNLDLSDDKLFTPLELDWNNADLLAQQYAFDVSFETFVHNKIISVSAPLYIVYYSQGEMFACNFSQHVITQYKGTQIAISSGGFTNLSYDYINLAFINNLKKGDKVVKYDDIYSKNEYIEIEGEILKILGVNTNKNCLVLEKIDLPKSQLYAAQKGYKPYPFQGEEFTTKTEISLDSFRGKYVLLDFWAEWCAPCLQEIPNLKELYAKTDRTKFEIIGIVGKSSPNGLEKLIDKYEITWSQILSDDIIETYKINGYPTTLLIDTEGFIIAKDLFGKELEETVLNLFKE